jgi:modification methylase
MKERRVSTKTSSFGVGKRESHDSSNFYRRSLASIEESRDVEVNEPNVTNQVFERSSEQMAELPDNSVALMVTSPPYHVGKDYDSDATFGEYLDLLERVFTETYRVLQPGGRAVVNVANLGRRPYVPLSHEVTARMLRIGFLMRAEVIWFKARGATGSCAWGSWRSAANPVIRDLHEYCLCFSKGRFSRVVRGDSDISADEFMESTLSIWEIPAESASRVNHPAPFPPELPGRFIKLYTYRNELVLDPFIGSGSTAVAAVQTGRRWIGYDTNPEYCAMTRQRASDAVDAIKTASEASPSMTAGAL